MKQTTQSIQNWINNPTFKSQIDSIFTTSANYSTSETSISELKEQYDYIIENLSYFIEKGILDDLSFQKRNQINTLLHNLTPQIKQAQRYGFDLSKVPNVGNVVFTYILTLKDLIDEILYYNEGKGAVDYITETKELIKIKNRYLKLVNDIEDVELKKDKIIKINAELTSKINELEESLENLKQNSNSITNLNSQIEKLYNQTKINAEDIESKKITINSLYKLANELEIIFQNSNTEIKKIQENSFSSFKNFIEEKTKIFNDKAKEFDTKTSEIVSKNESLQLKINTLLEGANAGELYKAFNTRKKDIEEKLNFWFWGIVGINVFLVFFTLLIINGSEFLGIKALSATTIDAAFYLKLFISIPLLFLDWFIIRQYNQRKDLAEKYAFKSVLSLSLLAYNEMMLENKENQISLEFISNTVEKIYQSPFESKNLSKAELDVLNKLAEKGLEKIEVVKKIIE